MFFGVGYKEHMLIVQCAPYGEGMFGGAMELMSVGAEEKLVALFGERADLDTAMAYWSETEAQGRAMEVGEFFQHARVGMFMDNPHKPMYRAPTLYITEGGVVKAIPGDEEETYALCVPGDENHASMRELGVAIRDYEKDPAPDTVALTAHIARFIHSRFNLPSDASIRYLNFKTGKSLGVGHEQPTGEHAPV